MLTQLKKLIPPPGQFILIGRNRRPQPSIPTNRLDIFREPKVAKKVYTMYTKSWNNATSLLNEAVLLFKNNYYARCVAIGITAWEELGKSQIAADYYSGMLSETTYKKAFRDHGFKSSYFVRQGVIGVNIKANIALNFVIGKKLENIRQNALYVSEVNEPDKTFNKEQAEFLLERIQEHKEYIEWAESLNGRIGSKALFK